jgi:dihydrofolate reductase
MRKIIIFMVASLDGFVSAEDGNLNWENRDPEAGMSVINELLQSVDTMILGRALYKGFEQAWPAVAKNPGMPPDLVRFAQWIENSPKIVFSNTLQDIPWGNSRLVTSKGDSEFVKRIEDIKRESGKDIVVFGGVQIAQTLTRLGFVDEFWFKMQAIALGKGKPLFLQKTPLKLIKSKEFNSGVVYLKYEPIRDYTSREFKEG